MMHKYNQLLLLCIGLSLWGCPEDTGNAGGEAGMSDGGSNVSGEMMSGEDSGGSTGAMMMGGPCFSDDECADDAYCQLGDSFEGSCVEGCREDSCEGGQVCDLDSRA